MADMPTFPGSEQPDDDLPEVFASLTGIDIIDGELVPRVSKPRPA